MFGQYLPGIFIILLCLLVTAGSLSVVYAQHAEHAVSSSSRQGQVQQGVHSGGGQNNNGRAGSSSGYGNGAYASSSSVTEHQESFHGTPGRERATVRNPNDIPEYGGSSHVNNEGFNSHNEGSGQQSRNRSPSNMNLHGFGEISVENTENNEDNNENESTKTSEFDATATLWKSLGESFASLGYIASKSGGGANIMRQAASLIAPLFSNLAQLLQMQRAE